MDVKLSPDTPQFGGLDSRELLNLPYGIFELPIIGFDVVEVAPTLDDSKIVFFDARKIITNAGDIIIERKRN
ncbi:unnamed protein product [marine sediment metagenome]|uniref:Uncharacterized protein n=1 Tax=marine sediment metagenome TaxID=412755 RepID=X1TZI3_9ZZZZ